MLSTIEGIAGYAVYGTLLQDPEDLTSGFNTHLLTDRGPRNPGIDNTADDADLLSPRPLAPSRLDA